jgi:TM2 domain-containing membrane protein YozV
MSNWYLLRNGQTHGPYPEEEVRQWVRAGHIAPDEKLNREGDANWLSLDMIPEFAKDRATAPPWGVAYGPNPPKDKMVAGVLAILLGGLGIHHFYLGNTNLGIIYLVLALFGVAPVLGIVDGIIYLTKPEDQFQRNYHNWFCSGQ